MGKKTYTILLCFLLFIKTCGQKINIFKKQSFMDTINVSNSLTPDQA